MFGYTLTAIEFRSMCDALYHLDVETVRLSFGVRKDQSRRCRIAPGLQLFQLIDHGRRQGHCSLLVVLRFELPDRLRCDAHHGVTEVNIAPGHEADLTVAES